MRGTLTAPRLSWLRRGREPCPGESTGGSRRDRWPSCRARRPGPFSATRAATSPQLRLTERGAWPLGHVPGAGPGRGREEGRWRRARGASCGARRGRAGACRRHHAAEAHGGADQRLVHHRQSCDRCRVLGRGGAGWHPVQSHLPRPWSPGCTGTVNGCGVSAGCWACALRSWEMLLTPGVKGRL